MSIAGVPAGAPPGTKAGTEAGDKAGEKTDVTTPSLTFLKGGSGTVTVGTVQTQICTVPLRGIEIGLESLTFGPAPAGGTVDVNARLDGEKLLSTDQHLDSEGTIVVSPDQNRQAANAPTHQLDMVVTDVHGASGTIIASLHETLTGLHGG